MRWVGGGQQRNSLPNVPVGPQSSVALLLCQPTPHHNLASSLNFGETEAQRKRLSCKHGLGSRKLKFQLRLLEITARCSLVAERLPSKLSPTVIDQIVTDKLQLKFDSRAPGGLTPSGFSAFDNGQMQENKPL